MADETFQNLKSYLIDPLTARFDNLEQKIDREIVSLKNEMKSEVREIMDQNKALMTMMLNPESGYVPRAEIQLMRDSTFAKIDAITVSCESRCRELRDDFEKKLEKAEREMFSRISWGGGIVTAVLGTVLGVLTYLHK